MRAWCNHHALPCLPSRAADVAAESRRGLGVDTLTLRRAAIRYLHVVARCPVPTAETAVGETMAGILRRILAPIAADLAGLRDRALLLVGFSGALRRAELAAIPVEHLETCERGLRLTLLHSKGERTGRGVTVAIPYGSTEFCPVRARCGTGGRRRRSLRGRCSGGSGFLPAAATAATPPAPRRQRFYRSQLRRRDHSGPGRPRRLPEKTLDLLRVVDRGPCLESGARQRLPSRTTLRPPGLAVSGNTTLLRRFGETFHCRPSSVMTVTVFLL